MAEEVINPFDQFEAPAPEPATQQEALPTNPFDQFSQQRPTVTAPLTVYTPGKGDPKMEGRFATSSGAPMHTLEAFQRGEAPYVTGAVHPDSPLLGKSLDIQIGDRTYPVKLTDSGPGVSTIDIASETGRWANHAPKEFGDAKISPSSDEHYDNPFDRFMPDVFTPEEQIAAAKRITDEHPILKNAVDAVSEYVSGMVPKNATEYIHSVYPMLAAFDQGKALASGDLSGIPLIGRIPEIIEAERTPAGSKERFSAGLKTVLDMMMFAGVSEAGAAAKVKPIPSTPVPPPIVPPTAVGGAEVPGAVFEVPVPVQGSGKFRPSYQIDKQLGDMMEGIGASRESGALRAEIASRQLLDELSEQQQADLGRYLISRRLKTVNPQHPQILNDAEMANIEADPEIAKSLATYVQDIKPDIEALRMRAGLSEQAAASKEPEFISLIPKTEELLPNVQPLPPTTRAAVLSRTTKFAQQAAGLAKEYDTNLRNVLSESYSEAMRKARVADFYKAVMRKGLSATEKFEDLPPELQHDLRAATESKLRPSGALAAWRGFQRFSTSAALTANPAELLNHMRRQLHILASKPPIGRGLLARLEGLVPYIGPKAGSFVRVLTDDMSKPENMAVLRDIFDAGGGSARSFSEMYSLRGTLAKWSGLKWLQRKTHKLLFGIPEGRGVGGWDLRMRVQLEKIRRAAEHNADPQRIREFANQIGQYGSHPDWIVGALRELNPYAATTLPMRWTELKTAVGMSGLKSGSQLTRLMRVAETQLRGTGGTILGLTAANYMLSGRWPWQNDPGHEFDLNTGITGDDGKRIYVKFRVIGPELSRPVSTVNLPGISRETTAKEPQYLSAFLTGLANQGLSLVAGPAQSALFTALTGKVPYMVKSPGKAAELMDVSKTKEGQSRGVEQVKRAVTGMNPVGDVLMEQRFQPNLPPVLEAVQHPLTMIPGLKEVAPPIGSAVTRAVNPLGSVFSQSYEKKQSRKRQSRPTAAQIRARERRKAQSTSY